MRPTALAPLVAGWTLLACSLAVASAARAHKPSDGYLSLEVVGRTVLGHVELAVRDLLAPLSLDASGDGAVTWGELRARARALDDYVHARLKLTDGDAPCAATLGALEVTRRDGQAHVRLPVRAECPRALARLGVGYGLFADLDPTHRGLLNLVVGSTRQSAVLRPDVAMQARVFEVADMAPTAGARFLHGARHALFGLETLLLLCMLLLPSMAHSGSRASADGSLWKERAPSYRSERFAWSEVARVALAFVLSSALTLALSAAGVLSPPPRWVGCAVALCLLFAALANLATPGLVRWRLALPLGLVHGFGLATSLAPPLGGASASAELWIVPALGALVASLFVALAMCGFGALRGTWVHRRVALAGGSTAVALIAVFWFVERLFDVSVLTP